MFKQLLKEESGFIVSAELVLIATLLVIGLIVGLSEVQHAMVSELNDVADAIGEVNQSYFWSGFHSGHGLFGLFDIHAATYGSDFADLRDDCDNNQCEIACDAPANEPPKL
jgi:Flp pilus assembly pilin Flp